MFFRSQWHCGRPSWTLPLLRSFLWLQQKTYASTCPTELFFRDMSIVRTLERVSEQRQKPIVSGVFLVIVIQTYDSLDDLLQHHKHPQFTLSCFFQQSSNVKGQSVVGKATGPALRKSSPWRHPSCRRDLGRGRFVGSTQRRCVWACQCSVRLKEDDHA